jgi:hypothetical protein
MNLLSPVAFAFALLILPLPMARAQLPEAIAAPGETVVATIHAEGAQIYECKAAETGGQLIWQFREPIASLFRDGKTVGLHYAGPRWEIDDSLIAGKVSASAPAPSGKDIPWLKLDVHTDADAGPLMDVTTVQRINTAGGVLEGPCEKAGDLRAVGRRGSRGGSRPDQSGRDPQLLGGRANDPGPRGRLSPARRPVSYGPPRGLRAGALVAALPSPRAGGRPLRHPPPLLRDDTRGNRLRDPRQSPAGTAADDIGGGSGGGLRLPQFRYDPRPADDLPRHPAATAGSSPRMGGRPAPRPPPAK